MKLTPLVLKEIYSMLMVCEPFTKWNLPLPDEVHFIVTDEIDTMGTYMYDDGEKFAHIITISKARCGFLDTVVRVMAHEMIHASRHDTVTDAWYKHDATFRRRAAAIGKELGLDSLEL